MFILKSALITRARLDDWSTPMDPAPRLSLGGCGNWAHLPSRQLPRAPRVPTYIPRGPALFFNGPTSRMISLYLLFLLSLVSGSVIRILWPLLVGV